MQSCSNGTGQEGVVVENEPLPGEIPEETMKERVQCSRAERWRSLDADHVVNKPASLWIPCTPHPLPFYPLPPGLPNQVNTCFLSSSLISLYSLPPLHSFFRSLPVSPGPLSSSLTLYFHQSPLPNPRSLIHDILTSLHLDFSNGQQHCANRFLMRLFSVLDTELPSQSSLGVNPVLEKHRKGKCGRMHELVSVLVENVFVCGECKGASVRNYMYSRNVEVAVPGVMREIEGGMEFGEGEIYMENSAKVYTSQEKVEEYLAYFRSFQVKYVPETPHKDISLASCFSYSLRASLMSPGNELPCPTCHLPTRHYRQAFLRHLSPVLLLHIQRYDPLTQDKLNTDIHFPPTLDLGDYLPNTPPYRLKAVIYHAGTINCGHYTAAVRINHTWYHYNDDFVREIREPLVQNAYVLLYMRKKD